MKKRIFSLVLALMLCLSLLPMAALAASGEATAEPIEVTGEIAEETLALEGASGAVTEVDSTTTDEPSVQSVNETEVPLEGGSSETVYYVDPMAEGTSNPSCTEYTEVDSGTTTTWNEGWYVVKNSVELNHVAISDDANVKLILCDGVTLTVKKSIDGSKASLTIYGQTGGTGALVVTSEKSEKADGQNAYASAIKAKSITVNGGHVTATAASAKSEGVGATSASTAKSYSIDATSLTVNGGIVMATAGTATDKREGCYAYSKGIYVGYLTVSGGTVTATTAGTVGEDCDICIYDDFTLEYGTVKSNRDGGTVRVKVKSLKVSGGTLKLAEGGLLYSAEVSNGVKLADLPADGCAYWQIQIKDEGSDYKKTDIGFVTLGNRTKLDGDNGVDDDFWYGYLIKPCTHSTTDGVCEYCGKDAAPETNPTPTPEATTAPSAAPTPTAAPSVTEAPSDTAKKTDTQSPKTGDEAQLALWLTLAMVSAMAITIVVGKKKVR